MMNSPTSFLQCQNVEKTYISGEEKLQVLHGLDFELKKSEFVAITGESGCGKSTLLHLLGFLDNPTSGEITYRGQSLTELREKQRDQLRNKEFGFVFQFHYLLPEFSALENCLLPALIAGKQEKDVHDKAETLLDELRLTDRKNAKPNQLSGGEQQRLAVARSLINDPTILFMDEPTGNLDPTHSDEMVDMILEQQRNKNLSIILVTHNMEIASKADRHLQLVEGKLQPAIV
jgi:lipoprotein-releasing system ATP-binding protein